MYFRFGEAFVNGYLLDENLRLFAANRFGSQPGPTFYFQIVAVNLLPWTAILIGRLVDDVRSAFRRRPIDDIELLLWAWAAAVIGFFTPSRFSNAVKDVTFQGRSTAWVNFGTHLTVILEHIKHAAPEVWKEIAAPAT